MFFWTQFSCAVRSDCAQGHAIEHFSNALTRVRAIAREYNERTTAHNERKSNGQDSQPACGERYTVRGYSEVNAERDSRPHRRRGEHGQPGVHQRREAWIAS